MSLASHEVFEDGRLNIVGYRNSKGRSNYFDDTISVYCLRGDWKEYHFAATTLPGAPSLFNPINIKGTAILVPGQYIDAYALGMHKGKYKALVQRLSVRVYRDNNRNDSYDKEEVTIERGLFGINIHRASLRNRIVGADSAGCQVIQKREDYVRFIAICELAAIVYGNRFTYTLISL